MVSNKKKRRETIPKSVIMRKEERPMEEGGEGPGVGRKQKDPEEPKKQTMYNKGNDRALETIIEIMRCLR